MKHEEVMLWLKTDTIYKVTFNPSRKSGWSLEPGAMKRKGLFDKKKWVPAGWVNYEYETPRSAEDVFRMNSDLIPEIKEVEGVMGLWYKPRVTLYYAMGTKSTFTEIVYMEDEEAALAWIDKIVGNFPNITFKR